MRRTWLILIAACLLAQPVRAQVGVIIMAREPEDARQLAARAERFLKAVRTMAARGPISAFDAGRVRSTAAKLESEGRAIQAEVKNPRNMPISLSEKDGIKRDLTRVGKICAWALHQLEARAKPQPKASPSPKPH
jgi:predicted TIM-barrel fold metal-dependent hydrolase